MGGYMMVFYIYFLFINLKKVEERIRGELERQHHLNKLTTTTILQFNQVYWTSKLYYQVVTSKQVIYWR